MPLESCSTPRLPCAHLRGKRRRIRIKEAEVRDEEVDAEEKRMRGRTRLGEVEIKIERSFSKRACLLLSLTSPLAFRTLRMRFLFSSLRASFVSRVVISRGAISTDDFHTLFVEWFDERSIGFSEAWRGAKEATS